MEGKIGKSDHEIISFELCIDDKRNKTERLSLNYKQAQFAAMRESIGSIDWRVTMQEMNVNEAWCCIKEKMNDLIKNHIPVRKCRVRNEPTWFNREVKKCIESKKKAWNLWKKSKRIADKEEYIKREKKANNLIRNKKKEVEKNIVKYRKTNPKIFYSHVNRAKKTKNRIGPLINEKQGQHL